MAIFIYVTRPVEQELECDAKVIGIRLQSLASGRLVVGSKESNGN